ncbi:hypothetical protein, partial [Oleiphilus sp. HI0123]
DYRYSMRLLPTSIAALQLGELYSESQNQEQALKYYAQAAQAQGDIGQQAKLKLALIEIKQTPEKYLKAKHVQDPKGPLLVTIENHSPLNIGALQLRTQLIDANGKVIKIEEWSINETIPAQKRSPYYPAKVVYHLKTGEKVKTSISSVTLE